MGLEPSEHFCMKNCGLALLSLLKRAGGINRFSHNMLYRLSHRAAPISPDTHPAAGATASVAQSTREQTKHVMKTPLISINTWIVGPACAASSPTRRNARGRTEPRTMDEQVMAKRARVRMVHGTKVNLHVHRHATRAGAEGA